MNFPWYTIPTLLTLVVLVAMFIAKKYILLGTDVLLRVIFFLCVLLVLAAAFWQQPFTWASELALRSLGTEAAFQALDEQLVKVDPGNWWDDLSGIFDGDAQTPNPEAMPERGYVMQEVYPGVVNAVSIVLRVVAFFAGLFTMLFGTYLSYSTYAAGRITHLEQELHKLKQRVDSQPS